MFETMLAFLFGWRKASKCKKQIRRVQCRLKLLKNKRCSIVRQVREDVAELLKHGHEQTAFDRVEQLFRDESIVAAYDLLDHFCEFIIINLTYIRRHKDCPNDINEAVSSLIFASARFGDLPELRVIRKLFGERYGQRFAVAALELLPGNLVNHQIKENLSIKSVPNDVKYRFMDEIARSCLQPGPLALEYSCEQQQQLENKSSDDHVPDDDVQTNYNRNEESQLRALHMTETERKIIYVDFSSKSKKFEIQPCHSHQESDTTGTSTCLPTVPHSCMNTKWFSVQEKQRNMEKYTQLKYPYEFTVTGLSNIESLNCSGTHNPTSGPKEGGIALESSSESSAQFPKEMIYLDGIEEFKSPISKDGNWQDQRLFMFKSSIIPTNEKFEVGHNKGFRKQHESKNEEAGSRSSSRSRKAAGKRPKKRSVSWGNRSVTDVDCAIYYGGLFECSSYPNRKSHHQRKHQKKILMEKIQNLYGSREKLDLPCCIEMGRKFCSGEPRCEAFHQIRSRYNCSFRVEMVNNCSLEQPCYFCVSDDRYNWESPPWKQTMEITTLEGFPTHDLKEEKLQHGVRHSQCSCNVKPNYREVGRVLLPQQRNYQNGATNSDNQIYPDLMHNNQNEILAVAGEGWDSQSSSAASIYACSSPWTKRQTQPPYLRAKTMPPERPEDNRIDNILRSNSFPFEQPGWLSNGSSSSRHVHPKLPDYDELAAKFMALKKANLQNKCQ